MQAGNYRMRFNLENGKVIRLGEMTVGPVGSSKGCSGCPWGGIVTVALNWMCACNAIWRHGSGSFPSSCKLSWCP